MSIEYEQSPILTIKPEQQLPINVNVDDRGIKVKFDMEQGYTIQIKHPGLYSVDIDYAGNCVVNREM